MQYRGYGKRIDWRVSALGFGGMRFPFGDADVEQKVDRLLRRAIDGGVNYIDTAYPYGGGKSEELIGKIIKGDLRGKVRIATKIPTFLVQSRPDMDRFFAEQMRRLQSDYVDFYLLHCLTKEHWERLRGLGVEEWLTRRQEAGAIGAAGFSFHDNEGALRHIIDAGFPFVMCQIAINYANPLQQAGLAGLRYAASRGLGVVIMCPLQGGGLASPPEAVARILGSTGPSVSPAVWALRWLWDQPEVSCVLSGMRSIEVVAENLGAVDSCAPGSLTEGERDALRRAGEKLRSMRLIPCTQCAYCVPCPAGVVIPGNLLALNEARQSGSLENARRFYLDGRKRGVAAGFWPSTGWASLCTDCRECDKRCPNGIPVHDWMKKVEAVFERGESFEDIGL